MKRRFCDICGKDITYSVVFELGIYDEALERDCVKRDLCDKCKKKIVKFVKAQVE